MTSTCPFVFCLLVSFIFENEIGCLIQCAPKFGESGWTQILLGLEGSAFPPGIHSPFTYFHLVSPTGTKSSRNEYMECGSKPLTDIFITGNIRLQEQKIISTILHEFYCSKDRPRRRCDFRCDFLLIDVKDYVTDISEHR